MVSQKRGPPHVNLPEVRFLFLGWLCNVSVSGRHATSLFTKKRPTLVASASKKRTRSFPPSFRESCIFSCTHAAPLHLLHTSRKCLKVASSLPSSTSQTPSALAPASGLVSSARQGPVPTASRRCEHDRIGCTRAALPHSIAAARSAYPKLMQEQLCNLRGEWSACHIQYQPKVGPLHHMGRFQKPYVDSQALQSEG